MTDDAKRTELQCKRCGSSMYWESCPDCDGGLVLDDDFYANLDATKPCASCDGEGGKWICLSTAEWCDSHPLPGREDVPRSIVEEVEAPA